MCNWQSTHERYVQNEQISEHVQMKLYVQNYEYCIEHTLVKIQCSISSVLWFGFCFYEVCPVYYRAGLQCGGGNCLYAWSYFHMVWYLTPEGSG